MFNDCPSASYHTWLKEKTNKVLCYFKFQACPCSFLLVRLLWDNAHPLQSYTKYVTEKSAMKKSGPVSVMTTKRNNGVNESGWHTNCICTVICAIKVYRWIALIYTRWIVLLSLIIRRYPMYFNNTRYYLMNEINSNTSETVIRTVCG